jgi:hypothetical protein
MIINLIYDAQALAAQQSFRDGMQTAANLLQAAFNDNITINIDVGYGEIKGQPVPGNFSEGSPRTLSISYANLRTDLANSGTSADDITSINALPTTASLQGQSNFFIATAEGKALGLVPANDGASDGAVGMNINLAGDSLVSVALHELTHVMGRVTGSVAFGVDLFRYDSPGHHVLAHGTPPAPAAYFSIDGGITDLADFGINSDPGDFLTPPDSNRTPNDPFNESAGNLGALTAVDLTMMDVLGFHRAGSPPPNPNSGHIDEWKIADGNWAGSVDLGTHGTDTGTHAGNALVAGIGDFNGDGTSDILWFNPASNDANTWKMSNGKWAASTDIGTHPAGWQPAGVDDFNHDGTSDILWFNPVTRDIDLWKVANGQWAGSVDVGSHPAGWQPVGVGDFNHDGTSDVLWYNATSGDVDIWKISNGQWAGSVDVGPHPFGWQPVGVGDFNHDGTSDVLWYNATSGDVDIWKISNGQWAGSVDVGSHPLGWQPVGVGDFNHDGTSDVLWYNATSGDVDIWKISNGQWAGSVDIGSHPAGWVVAGAGDFTGDGTTDVLWRLP